MIRVARVITRLNIGGPTLQVFLLHGCLRQYGFKTDLYCGELEPGEQEMTYMAAARGIEPVRLKGLGRDISPFSDFLLIWRLFRIFRRTKPAIVHTHQAKAGAVGRIAAWLARVPVRIHTFHGNVFRGHFSPLKVRIFIRLERFLSLLSTRVIAISRLQERDLTRVFRVAPTSKVRVIPLGFDLSPFDEVDRYRNSFRARFKLAKDDLLVGIIGRLEPVKNHRLFLEAASIVCRQRKDVRFVIVGDGKLRPDIESWIRELRLDGFVTLAGYVREIHEVLADLDIVAITSHSEGTPVSLIEAMAAGRAVISTRVGGVPDLIDNNVTGVLVEPGDPQAYAQNLIALLDSRTLRERLAEAARKKVRSLYTADRLTRDICGLYREALGSSAIDF